MPIILVAFFLLVLQQIVGLSAQNWPPPQLTAGWQWVTQLGERLDPQITIETIPAEVDTIAAVPSAAEPIVQSLADLNALSAVAQAQNEGAAPVIEGQPALISSTVASEAMTAPVDFDGEGATAIVLKNAPNQLAVEPSPTTLPTATPTEVATEEPTATAVETPTAIATATEVATALPSKTATPIAEEPTATRTTPARSTGGEPLVQVNGTATRAGALVATAEPSPASVLRSATTSESDQVAAAQAEADQPVAASILQPTATAEPVATATPTATALPPTATATTQLTTYKVQAGDTPLGIAGRFDIETEALFAANGLSAADARRLRVGQELIIPLLGQVVQPVATSTPLPTATTAPTAAPTVAPTAVPSATAEPPVASASDSPIRLDAVQLRSPENGSFLSCNGSNSLIWLPVSFMREGDRYLLHLGFLSGYNTDGTESIVWVLEQLQPANATIWHMDEGLCGLAPQDFGRQWRWYVEVVESTDTAKVPVSLPSAIWGFSWN